MRKIIRHYLYLDLGFWEVCNLKCFYCRNKYITSNNKFTIIDLKNQIEVFLKHYRAGVIKVSGYGEITLWPEFSKALDYLHGLFPKIQVISNGVFNNKVLKTILRYNNVSPNLTIDGHTLEMNLYRNGGNKNIHKLILSNLKKIIKAGRKVEVNCVLHDKNIKNFESFCLYLNSFANSCVMLFPYPVKIFAKAGIDAQKIKGDLKGFAKNIDYLWDKYSSILPPIDYSQSLKKFILNGHRKAKCYVNWVNIGSGGGDTRLFCPNYGETLSYGPMSKNLKCLSPIAIEQELVNLRQGFVGSDCKNCFNHFDVINSFMEDRISVDELTKLPSLENDEIKLILIKIKEEYEKINQKYE